MDQIKVIELEEGYHHTGKKSQLLYNVGGKNDQLETEEKSGFDSLLIPIQLHHCIHIHQHLVFSGTLFKYTS